MVTSVEKSELAKIEPKPVKIFGLEELYLKNKKIYIRKKYDRKYNL